MAQVSDIMDAEEAVSALFVKVERGRSCSTQRRNLTKARRLMKRWGLDKERDWRAQYNMRAAAVTKVCKR